VSTEAAISRLIDLLAERRRQRGMSQRELAEALGYGKTAVQRWETHTREPPFEVLDRWADVLDADLLFLLSFREEGLGTTEKRSLLGQAAAAISEMSIDDAVIAVNFLSFQAQAKRSQLTETTPDE
jgi:transcriptional regulator with XRE-family HTH domain